MTSPSLRQRLADKQAKLKKNDSNGMLFFPKEGTTRVRVLPLPPDEDFSREVTHFYLGATIKGVISPSTLGQPCPILEKHKELKASKDPEDIEISKTLSPKRKYIIPVVIYTDIKGKELDPNNPRLMMVSGGLLNDIINLYMDEDDWGDFTDPSEGYDLKITRSGSGKMDTEYSVAPCQKTKIHKDYRDPIDLEEMVAGILPTYEEALEKLQMFLGEESASHDDEPAPPKKSGKKLIKRKSDI